MQGQRLGRKGKIKKKIEETFDVGTEGAVSIVGELLTDSLVGTFAPGVTTAIFSYKQKLFEKNLIKMIEEMKKFDQELSDKIANMEQSQREQFQRCVEIVTDFVLVEQQEEKISYMVNGLVELSSYEEIKEDFVLFYYDTLSSLRLVDIGILKFYYEIYNAFDQQRRNYLEVIEELGIDDDQYNAVREKLVRVGLFQTKHNVETDELYKNVLVIQEFLTSLEKGKPKKLGRFNRISKNDSYSISRFGRNFIEFFIAKE